MAIRKFLILSLVAAGTASVFSSALVAQTPAPVPAPLASGAAPGMMLDSTGIELGPGETIISGPPGLQAYGSSLGQSGAMGMGGATFQTLDPAAAMACANECYLPCDPGYYSIAEALYMKRASSAFTRSFDFGLSDFDWELGTRITLGRRFDCVDGYEFVYAGLPSWEEAASRSGAGLFGSQFVPGAGLDPESLLAFNTYAPGGVATNPLLRSQVDFASQQLRAEFHSFEFNRTYTGWDVIRCMIGLRTIIYNEDYRYNSRSTSNTIAVADDLATPLVDESQPAGPLQANGGALRQSIDNFLIGPQVGLEMYYPLSKRVFLNSRLKGGLYLDIMDSSTRLFTSTGVQPSIAVAGGDAEEQDLAGMIETSSQIGVHITPALSVFAGYDMMYLVGVATVEDQLSRSFGRLQGSSITADDNVLIHGITVGGRFEF